MLPTSFNGRRGPLQFHGGIFACAKLVPSGNAAHCAPESAQACNTVHYHAHIFLKADEAAPAEALRQRLQPLLPSGVSIGAFLPHAAGPLPAPMFQLDYSAILAEQVEAVLRQHTSGHSVLIHPLLADELAAHTAQAIWLGPVLPLYLDRL